MKPRKVDELLLKLESAQGSLVENQLGLTGRKLEKVLSHTQQDPLFTFISGATTPCGKSVIAVSPYGRERIMQIVIDLKVEERVLEIVKAQKGVNITTINMILELGMPYYIIQNILSILVSKGLVRVTDFHGNFLYFPVEK